MSKTFWEKETENMLSKNERSASLTLIFADFNTEAQSSGVSQSSLCFSVSLYLSVENGNLILFNNL